MRKDNIRVLVTVKNGMVEDVQATSHKVRAYVMDKDTGWGVEVAVGKIRTLPKINEGQEPEDRSVVSGEGQQALS